MEGVNHLSNMTEDVIKFVFLELESFQIQNEKIMETNNSPYRLCGPSDRSTQATEWPLPSICEAVVPKCFEMPRL